MTNTYYSKLSGYIIHLPLSEKSDSQGERDVKGKWKPSKSEAMFFPKKNTTYQRPDPLTFSDQNRRLEYTDEFKYLGCILTPDLLDDTEIMKRVNQAKAQIANLSNFFKSRASTWVKKLVFQSSGGQNSSILNVFYVIHNRTLFPRIKRMHYACRTKFACTASSLNFYLNFHTIEWESIDGN
jgi:hypothetical protein